jgi:hypothetical protein
MYLSDQIGKQDGTLVFEVTIFRSIIKKIYIYLSVACMLTLQYTTGERD